MVPKDNAFTNSRVTNRLVVRESVTAPIIRTNNIIIEREVIIRDGATITNEASGNSAVVFTTGDQTINGVKTFMSAPIFQAGFVINSLVLTSLTATSATIDTLASTDIAVSGGITLPTSGGVATPLTYNEALSTSVDFSSGSFAGSQTVAVKLSRVGNSVTMNMSELSVLGNGAGGVFLSTAIPTQFRPPENFTALIWVTDNNTDQLGRVTVASTGIFSVDKTAVVGAAVENALFTGGGGFMGFNAFVLSWSV